MLNEPPGELLCSVLNSFLADSLFLDAIFHFGWRTSVLAISSIRTQVWYFLNIINYNKRDYWKPLLNSFCSENRTSPLPLFRADIGATYLSKFTQNLLSKTIQTLTIINLAFISKTERLVISISYYRTKNRFIVSICRREWIIFYNLNFWDNNIFFICFIIKIFT